MVLSNLLLLSLTSSDWVQSIFPKGAFWGKTRLRNVSLFVACLVDQFFPEVWEEVVRTLSYKGIEADFLQGRLAAASLPSIVVTKIKDLPSVSSFCGACHEVCPMRINIPHMLLKIATWPDPGSPEDS